MLELQRMDYMKQAISLANLAIGRVSPNPAVGALIVKDGEIVGQGYTQPPGSAHAEIVALQQAGDKAKGSTLYVTLEPCCHYGRTPPCTQAIIAAGVAEVHFAVTDPNPIVSGKGQAELVKSGITVISGEHEKDALEINEAYNKFITTKMPFITAKFALSLDGKIATRTGDSRWISSEDSRKFAHYLRYMSDAVMVGVNTVIVDDPSLTTKCCGGRGGMAVQQPLRVIIDGKGRTPLTSRLFAQPGKTLVAYSTIESEKADSYTRIGAELIAVPGKRGLVNIQALLQSLGKRDVTSILVEGGGTLLGSMFDDGQVDKVIAFIAPVIIGGSKTKTPVGGRGVDKIAEAMRLKRIKIERIGVDVMVTGYVKN